VLFCPLTRQTAIWYLNNGTYLRGVYGPTIPAGYLLVDAQDFNLDSKPDFLLYRPSTGQTAVWYLSGSTLIGGAYGPTIASGYTLVGAGDFNGDGHPDYVLDPPALPVTWNMGGSGGVTFLSGIFGPKIPTAWKLATEEAKPCGFAFVPGELHIGIAGGSFGVTVGSNRQSCAWQARTDRPDFIHLITPSGTGNGHNDPATQPH
jgi:FG-GAP-like repeat